VGERVLRPWLIDPPARNSARMGEGVRIGSIAGVETRVDWTTAIAFALISWSLYSVWLTDETTVRVDDTGRWVAAIAGTVLFYAGLLAHELAHALVARHHGLGVSSMTLWLFGGVASLDQPPQTARVEGEMALAGPATSIGLGAAWGVLALLGDTFGMGDVVVKLLTWLAVINVVLAVFNLVPAFPLDGGRILRSVVWAVTGERMRATRVAFAAGRVFAYGLMLVGALEVLGGGIGGLWMIFLGWFVLIAGRTEGALAVAEPLRELTVGQVMTPRPTCVPATMTVAALVDGLWSHRHSAFPVLDEAGAPVGLVDLGQVRSLARDRWGQTVVGDIVIPLARLPVFGPHEPASELLGRIGREGRRRALVIDDGRLVGVVTATDLARLLERAELMQP